MDQMRLLLLGISPDSTNMGVGALAAGLTKAAVESMPNVAIAILDYSKEPKKLVYNTADTEVEVSLVAMRYSRKLYLRNNIVRLILSALIWRIMPSQILKNKIIAQNYHLRQISEADIIGSVSGGDSFSDIYGLGRLIYVFLPQLLVILMKKKLVQLPQTLGPFKGRLAKRIAAYVLSNSDIVYSRDYESIEEVEAIVSVDRHRSKVRFCYDVGFVVDPLRPKKLDLDGLEDSESGKILIGLNISGLLYIGGYSRDNMFGFKVDYKQLIRNLIDSLIVEKDARILLIPHVFGSDDSSESNSVVCEKLYAELKSIYGDRLFLARGFYNQNEIKYIIGMCDFFIGSRMHACIGAVAQNIPTVSLAYSKKFQGVMGAVGLGDYVADPRVMNEHDIAYMIGNALEKRSEIRKRLEQKMPEVKRMVLNIFKDISTEQEK
jgi:colanic acid/amylovoran biosynthesis protein